MQNEPVVDLWDVLSKPQRDALREEYGDELIHHIKPAIPPHPRCERCGEDAPCCRFHDPASTLAFDWSLDRYFCLDRVACHRRQKENDSRGLKKLELVAEQIKVEVT